jgi:hypothetical protein
MNPIFKSLYVDSQKWRANDLVSQDRKRFADIIPIKNLGLAGLLSNGGYSGSVFFQQWFTRAPP